MKYKSVFITGASSGIGLEFAKYYAKMGAKVFVTARRAELLNQLSKELNSNKKSKIAEFYAADITKAEEVESCVKQALVFLGEIDLIICNAGIADTVSIENFSTNRIKELYDVNVFGVLKVIECFLPTLLKQKSGHIVTVSSLAAYTSSPRIHPYNATKAAIKNHMQGLAKELMPHNIAITCLCPGFIRTSIRKNLKKPLPFMMELDDSIKRMVSAIDRKKELYAFPWQLRAAIAIRDCF